MSLFFAPVANLVMSSVDAAEHGIASGSYNAIRELGGVFGVAVLASVFAHTGGYASPSAFIDGLAPAVWVGAVLVLLGAAAALLIPRAARARAVAEVADVADVAGANVRVGATEPIGGRA
jgi:hypothetical protein